jgi:hypothetical protein
MNCGKASAIALSPGLVETSESRRKRGFDPMKLVLQISAAALVVGLIGWGVSDPTGFRHKFWGYSQEEQKAAWQEVDDTIDRSKRELDERLLEAKIRTVELRYGDAAASKYRLCHTYPPETKQHQLECKRLDDQLARDDAKDAKHPW